MESHQLDQQELAEQRREAQEIQGRTPQHKTLYREEFEHDACGIGALASIKGERTHQMVDDALTVLCNLEHRGGKGLEKNTGDGAGILIQLPHHFFRKEAQKCGAILPNKGNYAVAMCFFPQDVEGVALSKKIFEESCASEGLELLFWREVPVDPHDLGSTAKKCMPSILQAFVKRPDDVPTGKKFDRKLYVARRQIEKAADAEEALSGKIFYICSFSSRTIVYKGMLVATQMRRFYTDLSSADVKTAIALVHSRYSTNTTPSWERAHPNRYIIHNGEINTLRGNVNWIRAREPNLYSPVLNGDIEKVMPIINKEGSDSAVLDNVLEFLVMNDRDMSRAVTMLVPEPWDHNDALSPRRRAFDEYQSMLMEPWDGPAALAYTDGRIMGAALDRNGLRPARYYVTCDDRFILSSEAGSLEIDPSNILQTGCLGPGEMLEIDTKYHRIVWNNEIRERYANQKPFEDWISEETIELEDLVEKSCPLVSSKPQQAERGNQQAEEGAPAAERRPEPAEGDCSKRTGQTEQDPRDGVSLTVDMAKHGYHWDDVDEVIRPMAETGKPPLASMGIDAPLACLSKVNRSFFDYFYQLFAQVTNPPIDALREHMVTSTCMYLGNHGNMLEDCRDNTRSIRLPRPVLNEAEFNAILNVNELGFKAKRFFATYKRDESADAERRPEPAEGACSKRTGSPLVSSKPQQADGALKAALDQLCTDVEQAVADGVNIIVISDRAGEGEVPIPSLLALGAVHNHMLRKRIRTFADLVVETGDAISAHDFSCLLGYSASGIYPYMAHECIKNLPRPEVCSKGSGSPLVSSEPQQADYERRVANYNDAVTSGITSIMSKMGISTCQSYHSAQIFEAVGFNDEFIENYFAGTTSRVGGLGVAEMEEEQNQRYDAAVAILRSPSPNQLPSLGLTKWRPLGGEEHLIDPQTIYMLQMATHTGDYEMFKQYSAHVHPAGRAIRLRDLVGFESDRKAIDISEVEPASEIVKRFNTGAMSYGSISEEAHKCMAIAMNRLGGRSNSGEGGEDPAREIPLENGDSLNSAIKQVASGRFGVTSRYLCSGMELQIKMAQGAKPGEGGHLPGKKVYPWIAKTRQSTPGIGLISPPPHHDIYSIEDLAELIFDLKNANPAARISVKLCSEAGVGTIATGVAKGLADKILISGHNGGSGAAPRDSIWHAGLPLELGIAETQQTLLQNGLRSRVVLEADGKLMDGTDVAVACLLGAEEFGFATMPLIAMGCLMQRDCQQDTCPAGIATQNSKLRCHFRGKPEYVVNFMMFVAEQLREVMASLGFKTVDEMVGHAECLKQVEVEGHKKANLIDLSQVLTPGTCEFGAQIPGSDGLHFDPAMAGDMELDRALDTTLFVPLTKAARESTNGVDTSVHFEVDIANVNRCVGTILGSTITKAHPEGLADNTIVIDCKGSAGQSFGAFLPRGVTLNVIGDGNDYFGKGLSGGILSVHPSELSTYKFDENIAIGNVAFFGATSGRGFVNGRAGQRFGVRNSGATIVVEGCGNHGCEYMTGGTALILGEVGQNFAAGMTGGVAYVYDERKTLDARCNKQTVKFEEPTDSELKLIHSLIEEHVEHTQSPRGIKMLYRWEIMKKNFVKVIPAEYEHVLKIVAEAESEGKSHEEALEIAFDVVGKGVAA